MPGCTWQLCPPHFEAYTVTAISQLWQPSGPKGWSGPEPSMLFRQPGPPHQEALQNCERKQPTKT